MRVASYRKVKAKHMDGILELLAMSVHVKKEAQWRANYVIERSSRPSLETSYWIYDNMPVFAQVDGGYRMYKGFVNFLKREFPNLNIDNWFTPAVAKAIREWNDTGKEKWIAKAQCL